jgi:hypothetical protein
VSASQASVSEFNPRSKTVTSVWWNMDRLVAGTLLSGIAVYIGYFLVYVKSDIICIVIGLLNQQKLGYTSLIWVHYHRNTASNTFVVL